MNLGKLLVKEGKNYIKREEERVLLLTIEKNEERKRKFAIVNWKEMNKS
jgi:hypothetical protein